MKEMIAVFNEVCPTPEQKVKLIVNVITGAVCIYLFIIISIIAFR